MKTLAFITLLSLISSVESVEITNFKAGLACTDGETFGWICHETNDIYITGQGKCVYNKQEKPCTWHGFSFDYTGVTEDTEISCNIETSVPSNLGNPKEEISKNQINSEFILEVPIGDGHFFNPQYSVLSFNDHSPIVVKRTSCFVADKLLFEINKRHIYPSNPLK
ncbi:MAG: hypothetical protein OQJ95_04175 [Kangiella sp.]|jgi:hypothetical protein|nr:hypothetical protein [Kangiella sp.]